MAWRKLTDAQWREVEALLPPKPNQRGRGKPRVSDRKCLEGILWILWTGCPWSELPRRYGSYTTCWRRLKEWEEKGVWEDVWHGILQKLYEKGKLHLDEVMMDGSFASAKKGGRPSASRGKERVRSGC